MANTAAQTYVGATGATGPTGTSAPTVAYGTSLPASPVDGQETILVDSISNPSYQWRFRYNVGSTSSYKWEFVGGTPAYISVTTAESTSSSTYAALTTAGPSFTLPRAGDYNISIGFQGLMQVSAALYAMSYDIGGTGAVDADYVVGTVPQEGTSGNNDYISLSRTSTKTGLSAVALTAKYKTTNSKSATFKNRWFSITPVRVS